MTIQEFSSLKIGSKANSILSLALKQPIQKKEIKKSAFLHINKEQLKSSIDLVNVKKFHAKPSKVPINSGYHKIDWEWEANNNESTVLSNDKQSVCFHAECESCFETDAIRGNEALKQNAFTYWEVIFLNERTNGTSIQIGIGNKNAKLNSLGYVNLLGSNNNSYGLTHSGQKWHRNESTNFCESWNEPQVTIGCLFNGFTGELSYYKNGVLLGVAFKNIDMSEPLYPMISSTVAQSAFRLGYVFQTFPNLKELCRSKILKQCINIENECLPKSVLEFLRN